MVGYVDKSTSRYPTFYLIVHREHINETFRPIGVRMFKRSEYGRNPGMTP